MDEPINDNHLATNRKPVGAVSRSAIKSDERVMVSTLSDTPKIWRIGPISASWCDASPRFCSLFKLIVDPFEQIGSSYVADEKEKAKCGLVETAVSERVRGDRATNKMGQLAARLTRLVVLTAVVRPIAAEKAAIRPSSELSFDLRPGRVAIHVKVRAGDAVGNSLEVEAFHHPVEKSRGVPRSDDCLDAWFLRFDTGLKRMVGAGTNLANALDDVGRKIQRR